MSYRAWPADVTAFTRSLVPGSFRKFQGANIRSLKVDTVAGNVAVAFVLPYTAQSDAEKSLYSSVDAAEDPVEAIVATGSTPTEYLPTIAVRDGQLSVTSTAMSYITNYIRKRESERINTLILLPLPSRIDTIDVSLKFGEAWVFGPPLFNYVGAQAGGAAAAAADDKSCPAARLLRDYYDAGAGSFTVPSRISVSVYGGDCNILDCFATKLQARNRMGDANVMWSLAPEGKTVNSCDEGIPALVHEISAQSTLGDARVSISGCKALPSWMGHAKNSSNRVALTDAGGRINSDIKAPGKIKLQKSRSAAELRYSWIFGSGKEFLGIKPRYAGEN